MKEQCSNCFFSRTRRITDTERASETFTNLGKNERGRGFQTVEVLECRASPPVDDSLWPQVDTDDWCGVYMPDNATPDRTTLHLVGPDGSRRPFKPRDKSDD